ncbi:MAG: sensor histidine kinase [Chloroflexota bacterium]
MDANQLFLVVVFFLYGLAFFSMGLAIILEGGRSSDELIRLSLRPLAVFGILHGLNEWIDMLKQMGLNLNESQDLLLFTINLIMLAFSFISLSAFGFSLLSSDMKKRRLSFLAPLILAGIWGIGLTMLSGSYAILPGKCQVACAWTRYSLGIPAALSASFGLIAQQRTFRRAGLISFGRDSLVAAIAFAWYGIIGQLFVKQSRLPPSTFLNEDLFRAWFGFPVQLLRAGLAIIVAISIIRFMRSFDEEIRRQISDLKDSKLHEAQKREELRGRLLNQVVSAQESERQRIARELHDDTGQTLTAIGLGLRGVYSKVNENDTGVKQNLRKLEAMTSNALNEIQRIILNLRPAHLDDLGLAAAIRWFLNDVRNHTDTVIHFTTVGEEVPVNDAIKITTYRVIQEATTNMLKHAHAKNYHVELTYKKNQIQIETRDDGIGMDPKILAEQNMQSWGLIGMQERINLLEGQFKISSSQGHGTRIKIEIPYQTENSKIISTSEEKTDDN